MTEPDDPMWLKLDQVAQGQHGLALSIERMTGEQRVSSAEMKGKMDLLGNKLETLEKSHSNDREATTGQIKVLTERVEALEGTKQFTAGKSAMLATSISIAIALVGLAAKFIFQ